MVCAVLVDVSAAGWVLGLVAAGFLGYCSCGFAVVLWHCLSDWIINENKTKCFKCISDLKSWDESEAYCKDHRGHLASVSSLQELKFVQDLCRINVDGCWIGGRGQSTSGHGWMWSDHKSLHNDSFLPKVQHVSNCGNLSCNNGSDSCSLLSDGAVPIKATWVALQSNLEVLAETSIIRLSPVSFRFLVGYENDRFGFQVFEPPPPWFSSWFPLVPATALQRWQASAG
uniref:C-type lectin domain-containing protein n=1 Tax=Chenopodium quinoa TaxID=63459 RepID=A0A803N4W7_CHEQI